MSDPKRAPWWLRLLDADGDGAITIGDVQRWFLTAGMIKLLWTGNLTGAIEAVRQVAVPPPAATAPAAPAAPDTDVHPAPAG